MNKKGVPCRCPRTGGLGQGQHLLWRRVSQSKKRNSAAAETPVVERFAFTTGQERGRGGNSFSPHPFFFPPRPSENYQKSASGFSRKKVRILFRTDSQFVKFRFPASLGASPLALANSAGRSANEFSSNFQTSQSFFARRANAKRQFSVQKRLQIKI